MRNRSAAFPFRKEANMLIGVTQGESAISDRPGAGPTETPSVFRHRRFLDTIDSLAAFLSSGPSKLSVLVLFRNCSLRSRWRGLRVAKAYPQFRVSYSNVDVVEHPSGSPGTVTRARFDQDLTRYSATPETAAFRLTILEV